MAITNNGIPEDKGREDEIKGNDSDSSLPFSFEQIQQAKDFIWNYLNEGNKQIAVNAATTDVLAKNNLQVKEIFIGYEYNH